MYKNPNLSVYPILRTLVVIKDHGPDVYLEYDYLYGKTYEYPELKELLQGYPHLW